MFREIEMKEMVEINGGDSFIDGVVKLGSDYIAKTKENYAEYAPRVTITEDTNRHSSGPSIVIRDGRVGAGFTAGPITVDITFKY